MFSIYDVGKHLKLLNSNAMSVVLWTFVEKYESIINLIAIYYKECHNWKPILFI